MENVSLGVRVSRYEGKMRLIVHGSYYRTVIEGSWSKTYEIRILHNLLADSCASMRYMSYFWEMYIFPVNFNTQESYVHRNCNYGLSMDLCNESMQLRKILLIRAIVSLA